MAQTGGHEGHGGPHRRRVLADHDACSTMVAWLQSEATSFQCSSTRCDAEAGRADHRGKKKKLATQSTPS